MLAFALFVAAPAGEARAENGEAVGWHLESATQRIIVGRVVFEYDPVLEEEARDLVKELPQWWSDIEQTLAYDLDDALTIHFVTHAGRVSRATGMPDWVAGVANSPRGEIAISYHRPDGSVSDYDTVLKHEMVHVALHRATGGMDVPRWFHEGVAESLADEVSFFRAEALAAAIFGPGVPPREELERYFYMEAEQASVAYAASRDFVTFLRYTDGDGTAFRRLMSEMRAGHNFETSFIRAYDETLDELDQRWRAGLFSRFMWYPLIGNGTLPFLLFVPVGAVAWVKRRRKLAEGMARLEREHLEETRARLGLAELSPRSVDPRGLPPGR